MIDVMPIGLHEQYLRSNLHSALSTIAHSNLGLKRRMVLASWGRHWPRLSTSSASRVSAHHWATSLEAQVLGVQRRLIPSQEWWPELASYKFCIAPLGGGIQTPKVVEALLVLTIPIVPSVPAYVELRQKGWPLVLVDDYAHITRDNLTKWWRKLAPRLVAFRAQNLTSESYWQSFIGGLLPEK